MSLLPRAPTEVTRSLRRAIALLRLLATHGRTGWRLSDLAQQAGLDPGTAHRLLGGLCDEGLATRVEDTRRYALGPLAFELGLAAAPYFDLARLSRDPLAAVARELRGTLYLKQRSGAESVCLARHDGVGVVPALMLEVGGRRPLCLTAGGVAMLLTLPQAEQANILARNRPAIEARDAARWSGVQRMLERSRSQWESQPAAHSGSGPAVHRQGLRAAHGVIGLGSGPAAHGYALNLGDIAPAISAVAVPVVVVPTRHERPDTAQRQTMPLRDRAPLASLTLALVGPAPEPAQIQAIAQRLAREAQALAPLLAQLRH